MATPKFSIVNVAPVTHWNVTARAQLWELRVEVAVTSFEKENVWETQFRVVFHILTPIVVPEHSHEGWTAVS